MDEDDAKFELTKPIIEIDSVNKIVRRTEGKYVCNLCDQKFTTQCNLTLHIQSKHEGVKYACNQCDYRAKRQEHLTRHIQSVHKGV